MSEFKTPGGKTIATYVDPTTAHLRIKLVEGGQVPTELSGMYTSTALADLAIKTYLLTNEETQTKAVEKKEAKKKFVKDVIETLSEED
tara:strand:+ start:1555 stop:1818 length:264 start_codon:yes stop_codon:yes gene_type:complete